MNLHVLVPHLWPQSVHSQSLLLFYNIVLNHTRLLKLKFLFFLSLGTLETLRHHRRVCCVGNHEVGITMCTAIVISVIGNQRITLLKNCSSIFRPRKWPRLRSPCRSLRNLWRRRERRAPRKVKAVHVEGESCVFVPVWRGRGCPAHYLTMRPWVSQIFTQAWACRAQGPETQPHGAQDAWFAGRARWSGGFSKAMTPLKGRMCNLRPCEGRAKPVCIAII